MAQCIHAVWAAAAMQEAALLQAPLPMSCPALSHTGAGIFLGALRGEELVGALALGPGDEAGQVAITTLVVVPALQRQGIARTLLAEALRRTDGRVLTVVTAAANRPALALYRDFAFVEHRRGVMAGPADGQGLVMVQLRRPPAASS